MATLDELNENALQAYLRFDRARRNLDHGQGEEAAVAQAKREYEACRAARDAFASGGSVPPVTGASQTEPVTRSSWSEVMRRVNADRRGGGNTATTGSVDIEEESATSTPKGTGLSGGDPPGGGVWADVMERVNAQRRASSGSDINPGSTASGSSWGPIIDRANRRRARRAPLGRA